MRRLRTKLEGEPGPMSVVLARVLRRSIAWRIQLARWYIRARVERRYGSARAWFLRQPRVVRIRIRAHRRRAMRTDSARAWEALGDLHNSLGDLGSALVAWKRAAETEPSPALCDRYGYEQWQRGEWDEAHWAWTLESETRSALARTARLDRLPIRLLDRNWASVIGGMALLDGYLKCRILAGDPLEQIVLLALPHTVSNPCYLDYWRRYIPHVIDDAEAYDRLAPLTFALRQNIWAWPDTTGHVESLYAVAADAERRWETEERPPLLQLDAEHRERGRARLADLGVPEDAWFVTLHVREDTYHDVRNAALSTYERAIAAVVDRGGWVIRMGDPTLTPTPLKGVEHVLDYAHSDAKSDWMDVFLWADCRFLIGTCSGPVQVPGTFGVPVVQTNWAPVAYRYWVSRDLQIPKLYWSERERRLLSFADSIAPPHGFSQHVDRLADLGVGVVDNKPEELAEVVVEMLDRLDGRAIYTAEDEELQARFDALAPRVRHRISGGGVRRGRDFLRRYAELLD